MKTLLFILLGVGGIMVNANSSFATELKIRVSNIDVKRGGDIIVMIFAEDGFPKMHEKAHFIQTKNALQETMDFRFDLKMHEFAVKVLHDENGDGKVTKNWTGIYPKEGLGFSNGQRVSIKGAPKYKKSKVLKEQINDGLNISIRYP